MSAFVTPHQPYTEYVQGGLVDGQYTAATFTWIAAGPPRIANFGGDASLATAIGAGQARQMFFPLGVTQNFNLAQNMNVARFFELGSVRSYFIAGHVVGQISFNRVLYHGPSVLRTLYAYYQDLLPPTIINPLYANSAAATVANQHNVIVPPGYENIYLNLASDLFKQPVGLLFFIKDSNEDTLGANYAEACYVPSHTIATDAGQLVIQESVNVQYERLVPVSVKAISLISGLSVI